eukprot:10335933-Heterocapsa_arctica.AAC.1
MPGVLLGGNGSGVEMVHRFMEEPQADVHDKIVVVQAREVDEELLADESEAGLAREVKHEHEHEQLPTSIAQQNIVEIQQMEIVHWFVDEPQVEMGDKTVEVQ